MYISNICKIDVQNKKTVGGVTVPLQKVYIFDSHTPTHHFKNRIFQMENLVKNKKIEKKTL